MNHGTTEQFSDLLINNKKSGRSHFDYNSPFSSNKRSKYPTDEIFDEMNGLRTQKNKTAIRTNNSPGNNSLNNFNVFIYAELSSCNIIVYNIPESQSNVSQESQIAKSKICMKNLTHELQTAKAI